MGLSVSVRPLQPIHQLSLHVHEPTSHLHLVIAQVHTPQLCLRPESTVSLQFIVDPVE